GPPGCGGTANPGPRYQGSPKPGCAEADCLRSEIRRHDEVAPGRARATTDPPRSHRAESHQVSALMPGIFRKTRIATRLTGTIASALVCLCVMGAIAVFATRAIQALGDDLYVSSAAIATVETQMAVGIERAFSEVHSAPSELDLEKLKA